MPGDRRPWTVFVAAALLAVTGCTAGASRSGATPSAEASGSESTATATAARGDVPTPDHVVIVVYENKDAEQVVGSPDAPYLTSLSTSGADFTDAHAETHPSQPNYLALFSGSTQGVTDDSCPLVLHGDNTGDDPIATLLVGPMVQAGDTAQHVDHYSILRTIEEMYGLEPLGEAANRDPITDIWTSSAH